MQCRCTRIQERRELPLDQKGSHYFFSLGAAWDLVFGYPCGLPVLSVGQRPVGWSLAT